MSGDFLGSSLFTKVFDSDFVRRTRASLNGTSLRETEPSKSSKPKKAKSRKATSQVLEAESKSTKGPRVHSVQIPTAGVVAGSPSKISTAKSISKTGQDVVAEAHNAAAGSPVTTATPVTEARSAACHAASVSPVTIAMPVTEAHTVLSHASAGSPATAATPATVPQIAAHHAAAEGPIKTATPKATAGLVPRLNGLESLQAAAGPVPCLNGLESLQATAGAVPRLVGLEGLQNPAPTPQNAAHPASARGPLSARKASTGSGQGYSLHMGLFTALGGTTPRCGGTMPAQTPRTGRKTAIPVLQQEWEQRLTAWCCGANIVPSDARLVGIKPVNAGAGAPSMGLLVSQGELVEASLIVYGVEVICQLSMNGNGGSILGAKTPCGWLLAQLRVTAAGEESIGQPIEALLTALRKRWQEVEETKLPELEEIKLPELLEDRQKKHHRRSNSTGSSTVSSADSKNPCNGDTRGRGAHKRSRRSSSEGSVFHSRSSSRTSSESDVSFEEPAGPTSFGEWLEMKEALYRFDQCAQGLGWDHPLSKDEKRELLLLNICSGEREARKEIQQLKGQLRQHFKEQGHHVRRDSRGSVASLESN